MHQNRENGGRENRGGLGYLRGIRGEHPFERKKTAMQAKPMIWYTAHEKLVQVTGKGGEGSGGSRSSWEVRPDQRSIAVSMRRGRIGRDRQCKRGSPC